MSWGQNGPVFALRGTASPNLQQCLLYSRMIVIETAGTGQQSTTWFVMLAWSRPFWLSRGQFMPLALDQWQARVAQNIHFALTLFDTFPAFPRNSFWTPCFLVSPTGRKWVEMRIFLPGFALNTLLPSFFNGARWEKIQVSEWRGPSSWIFAAQSFAEYLQQKAIPGVFAFIPVLLGIGDFFLSFVIGKWLNLYMLEGVASEAEEDSVSAMKLACVMLQFPES